MIQFNLLPDVKLEYIKARRIQRLVLTIASLLAAFCIFIVVVLFVVVNVLQKTHLNDVNKDIDQYTKKLNEVEDLPKILTVQNQLKSLQNPPSSLLLQRPQTARLVGYINKVVPAKVNISQLAVDFTQHTMVFTGNADSVTHINEFIDTLKFTNYTTSTNNTETKAFSNVVLTTFSRGENGSTFTINTNYDQAIFDGSQQPTLTVPAITTTRSTLKDPLFNGATKNSKTQSQGQ